MRWGNGERPSGGRSRATLGAGRLHRGLPALPRDDDEEDQRGHQPERGGVQPPSFSRARLLLLSKPPPPPQRCLPRAPRCPAPSQPPLARLKRCSYLATFLGVFCCRQANAKGILL